MIFGIIGAMELETELLIKKIKDAQKTVIGQLEFYSGTMHQHHVVVVTSGIGKVNAAMCTQILISEFKVDAIINTGVSGAIDNRLNIGDVVVSTDCMEHDFDCTAFGYAPGIIPKMETSTFVAAEDLVTRAYDACVKALPHIAVFKGRIVSGDEFVSSPEKRAFIDTHFKAMTTEMEGAAIAHTAYLNRVPFVIIRAMSDKADGTAHTNFDEFSKQSALHSSMIVDIMLSY